MSTRGELEDTVAALTVAEKAALCIGADIWHTASVDRLGIEGIRLTDGPHGLRVQPREGDHVGLSGSLPATCFPTASALGATWDVDLARRVGAAIGLEARAQEAAVVLGPGVNIKRSPLCGRNFEYFSEDPYVSGRLGSALVEGIQSQGVGASVKHFAANNQETDRLRISADVDERTLREIYLPAFEQIVTTARPWTVMAAYNRLNGTYATENAWLLTELLRDEWGYDGLVMSDWGAVHDRVAALVAGTDLEMPPNFGVSDTAIVGAVESGALPEAVLDRAVRRVLQLVDRSRARGSAEVDVDVDAHHVLARQVAAHGIVLLKNDGVLPLKAPRICVVGEFARTPRYQGAGSSQVNPTRLDIPLDELSRAMPDAQLTFAPGFALAGSGDPTLADEAVGAAADADVVVAFLGLPAEEESEGFDRSHMGLPTAQTELLDRLLDGPVPVVVVLANGSTVLVSSWHERAAAVLECWLGGQAAGGAVADVLTGAVNPSGRLTETIPLRLQDTPSYLSFPGEEGHVRYAEGVFVGYRFYDAVGRSVAYPFGHGLSYTHFDYADLSVHSTGSVDADDLLLRAHLTVTNAGPVPGREVVQVYVGAPGASVARPPRELRGFTVVDLAPGESAAVELDLSGRDLAYWSTSRHRWLVEPGEHAIEVGASSRDIRLRTTVQVSATAPRPRLDAMATLQEWLADPEGAALIRAEVGIDAAGRPQGILGDPELLKVVGNFPLSALAAFPGLGISHQLVERLTDGT